MKALMVWDIYEVKTKETIINNIMLRGRIRKLWLKEQRNILTENTQDIDGSVRFAVPHWEDIIEIENYLKKLLSDVMIKLMQENIANPVLSKLKVNKEERYTL